MAYAPTFLPVSREDMEARGWDELDFLFISGDAYVDHPSFAAALLCRLLEGGDIAIGFFNTTDSPRRLNVTIGDIITWIQERTA